MWSNDAMRDQIVEKKKKRTINRLRFVAFQCTRMVTFCPTLRGSLDVARQTAERQMMASRAIGPNSPKFSLPVDRKSRRFSLRFLQRSAAFESLLLLCLQLFLTGVEQSVPFCSRAMDTGLALGG